MVFKFIFVLIVGILVIGISLYGFFGGNKDEEDLEDMFKVDDEENADEFSIDDYLLNENDEDDLEIIEGDEDSLEVIEGDEVEREDESVQTETEDEQHETLDEFDYEQKYVEQFGKEKVNQSLSATETIVKLWLNKENDLKKWKEHVTSSFLNELENTFLKDERTKAEKIESLEVFATEQINEDEMIIGCIANYDNKTELLNVIFVEENGGFLADSVVVMWAN